MKSPLHLAIACFSFCRMPASSTSDSTTVYSPPRTELPISSSSHHYSDLPSSPLPSSYKPTVEDPVEQTGTVALDMDTPQSDEHTCSQTSYFYVPDWCLISVTFKTPFPSSASPVVFSTVRTRTQATAGYKYPVLTATVVNATASSFSVLVYTANSGDDSQAVNIVLDYLAYDADALPYETDDWSQFGTLDIPDRVVATEAPNSVAKRFDEPFDEVPSVFAMVRLDDSSDTVPAFAATITELDTDHVKVSLICLDHITLSQAIPSRRRLDDDYTCLWGSTYKLDFRVWPKHVTYKVNGTDVTVGGGMPYHTDTEIPARPADTLVTVEVPFDSTSFVTPPGMLGMVQLLTISNDDDYLDMYALSLGINTLDTTSSFFATIASIAPDSHGWDNKLSVIWFAWNGTGTQCPVNSDSVICNGHGVCPDDSSDMCECDAKWAGSGCDQCATGFATSKCTACDGSVGTTGNVVCNGHGTCNDGLSGDGTCTCYSSAYTGDGCEQCADGWYGIPAQPFNQSCARCPYGGGVDGEVCNGVNAGTCNTTTGECSCTDNFDGINCTSCSYGRSGPNCELSCYDDCNNNGECTYRNVTGDLQPYCICHGGFDPLSSCKSCLDGYVGEYCCTEGYTGYMCDKCIPGYIMVTGEDGIGTECQPCNQNSKPDTNMTVCACDDGYVATTGSNKRFPDCARSNYAEIVIMAFGIVFLAGIGLGYWYYRKNRLRRKLEMHKLDILSERLLARNPQLQGMEQAFRTMTSDASDWLIQFDDIELGSVVGSGTSAHVFTGWYSDQAVAVKRLHSVRWDAKEFEAFFTQEAGLIARLHHPNVVRFFGVCYQDDHFYIVTEMCQENLSQALRRLKEDLLGPVPEDLALKLAYQIAKGMTYLHSKDIIHRDLKPENILIDDKGDVKLCDFGLSRLTTNDVEMTQQVGTPAYMAPEMAGIEGEEGPRIGKPVDVYSYGILLWTLWTQKLPYSDLRVKNPFQLMVKVTSGFRPAVPESMPPFMQGLMQSCWAGDPKARPGFAKILKELKAEMNKSGNYRSGGSGSFYKIRGSGSRAGSSSFGVGSQFGSPVDGGEGSSAFTPNFERIKSRGGHRGSSDGSPSTDDTPPSTTTDEETPLKNVAE